MPPVADEECTQVLDLDFSQPGVLPDHNGDCRGDGNGILGGETLPLDYAETQRVDSCDDQLSAGVNDWVETEVIDELQETEIVWSDDEGGQSERTELVVDDNDDFGGEVGSGIRTKYGNLADPDCSTDEDKDCGNEGPGPMVCSVPKRNNVGAKKDEVARDSNTKSSFRCIDGYTRYSFPCHEEETATTSERNNENRAAAHEETPMGYISSQEPGLHSQAMALGIVDKFLSINDVGLSQDVNNVSTDTVILPPIASVKKAQSFVMKFDKNTAGNVEIYAWDDSLEDESGGSLFSRREYSSFNQTANKQRSYISDNNNKGSNEGAKPRTCQKLARIACFGSKLNHNDTERHGLASKTRSNKHLNETVEATSVGIMKQLDDYDVHTFDEGVYDVGPATQMAAEAIHALCHSSPVKLAGTSIDFKKARNTPTRKRSKKFHESERIMTRSICKNNFTKLTKTSDKSFRKQSAKEKTKIGLERAVKLPVETTGKCLDENPNGAILLNNGESVASVLRKKTKKMADKEDKQTLVHEKSMVDASQLYTSPVAHRTRHSKASNMSNFNKTLFNNTYSKVNKKNELVLNASVARKADNGGLADAYEIERACIEESGASLYKDAYREPKRRKQDINLENGKSESKMDNHSKSVDAKLSVRRNKHRVFIKSIAQILDTVKRKRRSVSSSSKYELNELPSNVGKVPSVSGTRKSSSFLCDILKPYFANDSRFKPQLLSKPVDHENLEIAKKGAGYTMLTEVTKESAKPKASLDTISQPGLESTPVIGIIAVSPVSISQGSSKISTHKTSSSSSISRELARLEVANASPSKLNDMRRRKYMASFQVCFSNHLSQDIIKQQKKILARLGIQVVTSSSEATHFVADQFVRTKNMLEAMAMGKPVVTPMWLESCGQASCYIDEKNFILRDAKKEKEIGFSMPVSLAHACQTPLLQGKRLLVTRNAKPNQELISSLVVAAGGQLLKKIMRSITKEDRVPDNLLILSSEEDIAYCMPFLKKGAAVFRSELLLNGIVIQKLEYERHQLFLDQVKRNL